MVGIVRAEGHWVRDDEREDGEPPGVFRNADGDELDSVPCVETRPGLIWLFLLLLGSGVRVYPEQRSGTLSPDKLWDGSRGVRVEVVGGGVMPNIIHGLDWPSGCRPYARPGRGRHHAFVDWGACRHGGVCEVSRERFTARVIMAI